MGCDKILVCVPCECVLMTTYEHDTRGIKRKLDLWNDGFIFQLFSIGFGNMNWDRIQFLDSDKLTRCAYKPTLAISCRKTHIYIFVYTITFLHIAIPFGSLPHGFWNPKPLFWTNGVSGFLTRLRRPTWTTLRMTWRQVKRPYETSENFKTGWPTDKISSLGIVYDMQRVDKLKMLRVLYLIQVSSILESNKRRMTVSIFLSSRRIIVESVSPDR